jgi:DNA-binding response OmpR family regulator/REP element-mobilizing transposase RayT
MDLKILIATSDRILGEKIQQALEEANYSPILAPSTAEAAFIVQYENCPIAILDCDLPDPGPAYLADELREQNNDLRIIFIHPGEGRASQVEVNSPRDICLPQPFFLPDLLEVVHLWIVEKNASHQEVQPPDEIEVIPSELAWLQDVSRVAQYLTRLSLDVDAQAALIIQNSRIWAYAGQLSQSAAEELTQFVGHHWANGDGRDLARFVRLETTGNEYMLYVTNLGSGFVLALSFETEMPFSKIRAQTGDLARKLISPIPEPPMNLDESKHSETPTRNREKAVLGSYEWIPEASDERKEMREESRPINRDSVDHQKAMFDDLLSTLDMPDPDGTSGETTIQTETTVSKTVEAQHQEPEMFPETRNEDPLVLETAPSLNQEPRTQLDVKLVSGSLALHDLAYACVLIPRMPDHKLTGVITGLIKVEVSRLCLAFGWRLDNLTIDPLYLHWVVTVNPDEPASNIIRKIRENLSKVIYKEFPRLTDENPSGDFWAPGFLTIHGRRSLAKSLIQEYIKQTRARQGINKFKIE